MELPTITIEDIVKWNFCYTREKFEFFFKEHKKIFGHENISAVYMLDYKGRVFVPIIDKILVCLRPYFISESSIKRFTIDCIENTSWIYEEFFPGDTILRDGINIMREFVNNGKNKDELNSFIDEMFIKSRAVLETEPYVFTNIISLTKSATEAYKASTQVALAAHTVTDEHLKIAAASIAHATTIAAYSVSIPFSDDTSCSHTAFPSIIYSIAGNVTYLSEKSARAAISSGGNNISKIASCAANSDLMYEIGSKWHVDHLRKYLLGELQ